MHSDGARAILALPGVVDGSRVSLVVPSPRGGFEDQTRKTLPLGFIRGSKSNAMQAIDVEFYEANRAKLLKSCPGKWVGIQAGVLIGIWESCSEAYDDTVRLSGSEDVHVRQIVPKDQEPVVNIPTCWTRPVLNLNVPHAAFKPIPSA